MTPLPATPAERPHHPIRGALYIMAASTLFAGMSATVKFLAATLPDSLLVFGRNAAGLLFVAGWALLRQREALRVGPRPGGHLLRALTGLAAMACFFHALGRIPLAEAVLLTYTAPLLIPFLARLFLREPLTPRLLLPGLLGFGGILLLLKPGTALFQPAALVGLCSGAFAAGAMVCIRSLSATEPTARIVLGFAALGTLLSAPFAAPALPSLSPETLPLFLGIGLLATGGQVCLTRGYASAPAAQVGPFLYTAVLVSALIGYAAWGETIDRLSAAGGLLVTLANILALRASSPSPPSS